MTSPELVLKQIFAQLPVSVIDGENYPVTFSWGSQKDCNKHLDSIKSTNKYPLIWYVPNEVTRNVDEQDVRIKLIIAKNSQNQTSLNPEVWEREFETVLDPLLVNVRKALERSNKTMIIGNTDTVYRSANYSADEFKSEGSQTETKQIDIWNVIVFECDLKILSDAFCVQTINFN
jgi:hypothetical protein